MAGGPRNGIERENGAGSLSYEMACKGCVVITMSVCAVGRGADDECLENM
jgi:hypothetical protein